MYRVTKNISKKFCDVYKAHLMSNNIEHIIDSLNLIQYLKNGNILDIGSGAGFPSLPLAIFKTNLKFYLIDSKIKKVSFIRYVISSLDIKNVQIFS